MIKNARWIEYDDDYTKELCPNCFQALQENHNVLFSKGWLNKKEFIQCENCGYVMCRKP